MGVVIFAELYSLEEVDSMAYGTPKRDGSGRGVRANRGRNPACSPTRSTGRGRNRR